MLRTLVLTLTVTLPFDLSTQNHTTCRISQFPRSFSTPSLNAGIIYFWVMLQTLVWKKSLTDPVTLTFEPPNHVTSRVSQDHSLYLVEHFGIIRFSYARTNRQTDRQTESTESHTHADRHSRRRRSLTSYDHGKTSIDFTYCAITLLDIYIENSLFRSEANYHFNENRISLDSLRGVYNEKLILSHVYSFEICGSNYVNRFYYSFYKNRIVWKPSLLDAWN